MKKLPVKKNPIKTRQYFISVLKGKKWEDHDFPVSTLKDAEEIAKNFLTKRGITQVKVFSNGANGQTVNRHFSNDDYLANPKKAQVKTHKNYFIVSEKSGKPAYYGGTGLVGDKKKAAIFHDKEQAIKTAQALSDFFAIPVSVEWE